MTTERPVQDIKRRLDQLQNDDVYDQIKKIGHQTIYLDAILGWADRASSLLTSIRYSPVVIPEGADQVSALFNQIDAVVARLTKIANYCHKLNVQRHRYFDEVLSEAYWHSMGGRGYLKLADHHFKRSQVEIMKASPRELSESVFMQAFILAERYLDGVGVDVDPMKSHALFNTVIDDYEYEMLGPEGRRIFARVMYKDDTEAAKDSLKILWDEGYLASMQDLVTFFEKNGTGVTAEVASPYDQGKSGAESFDSTVVRVADQDREEQLKAELKSLNNMIGLASVKDQVKQLLDFEQVRALRRKHRHGDDKSSSRHMVLTGNPGTGKTTVAEKLAKLLYLIGVLKKDIFVVTRRSDLVAGFEGQTALKTSKVIESALGGVLFIDEAYSLSANDDQFGEEAISTLLIAMENHRSDLVVIVAGYTDEMNVFLKSNPGLDSRFKEKLHFEDYNASDMTAMLDEMSRSDNYVWETNAGKIASFVFQELQGTKLAAGNGRFVRNFYEKCIDRHHGRVAAIGDQKEKIKKESLTTITAADATRAAKDFGVEVALVAQPRKIEEPRSNTAIYAAGTSKGLDSAQTLPLPRRETKNPGDSNVASSLRELHAIGLTRYHMEKMK
jgi:stage V sporulation protein K